MLSLPHFQVSVHEFTLIVLFSVQTDVYGIDTLIFAANIHTGWNICMYVLQYNNLYYCGSTGRTNYLTESELF